MQQTQEHGGSPCEILQVAEGGRWMWRQTGVQGGVIESAETYQSAQQCAAAARRAGYRVDSKWFVSR